MLLDRVKTHYNVKISKDNSGYKTKNVKPNKVHSGCIDNVIYITKQSKTQLDLVFIGARKIPEKTYEKLQYDSLSDHSPVVIIEGKVINRSGSSAMSLNSSQSLNSLREEESQM